MQIIHKKDDFLFTIFPELRGDNSEQIISSLEKYYTYGSCKPKITLAKDFILIDIDIATIISHETDFKKAIAHCENGRYNDAKPILKNLINKNPTNSEFHRIMGQILSDEGDQDEAINYLIDALRWDPKNGWALTMMGNIFAKFKNDISTALKYYDQALIANPNDNIAVNNIGANLMQQGKNEQARKYFEKALSINPNYPNTLYALSLLAEKEEDFQLSFTNAIEALRKNQKKDGLYQNSIKQATSVANAILTTDIGKKIVKEYLHKLEFEGGTEIETIEDDSIPTAAKFEFAENHNRKKHVIRVKSNSPVVEHLQMHELVHLDLVIQARKNDANLLFITLDNKKADFAKSIQATINILNTKGFSKESISNYCDALFLGINNQIMNAPIDLFIENYLFESYSDLRPYQYLSLSVLLKESINAVTNKDIIPIAPTKILSASKIYNLVAAYQFKDLFGVDIIDLYKANKVEMEQANEFYKEYMEYKVDKEPGEEYDLVRNWAKDLKLDNYFELVNESEYRTKGSNIDEFLSSIENDPFDLKSIDTNKIREMEDFQNSQVKLGINMAVVMYMVEALQYFKNVSKDEIKKVAFEIAMLGTQGYRPDGKDYRIGSIPGKFFSGYHILAYYYISWMLAIPEMVPQLQLPYEKEYELAKTMTK